jgi:hypothetical protein
MYFIGNFQHLTDQQETDVNSRRHGTFSMMVEAGSSQEALDKFRQRLEAFRDGSALFEGRCEIYLTQLLEFGEFPQNEAVLLNLKSFAGDPIMPHIACVVPTEQSNACTIHQWENNQPHTEGRKDRLFLTFE